MPGRRHQIIGRDDKGRICCPEVWNVCVLEECEDRFIRKLERMLITSRGPTFRGPPHCVQPSNSRDADQFALNITLPTGLGALVEVVRVPARANETAVIKGIAFLSVSPNVKLDPYTRVRFTVLRGNAGFNIGAGQPVNPYVNIGFQSAVSLAAMSAVTITADPGQDIVLVAERFFGTTDVIHISGRMKGWCYTPSARAPGTVGNIAL